MPGQTAYGRIVNWYPLKKYGPGAWLCVTTAYTIACEDASRHPCNFPGSPARFIQSNVSAKESRSAVHLILCEKCITASVDTYMPVADMLKCCMLARHTHVSSQFQDVFFPKQALPPELQELDS